MKSTKTMSVPSHFDEDEFHRLCHENAANLPNKSGYSAQNIGEFIKAKVLDYLPSEFVTVEKYVGVMRIFADGRHEFKKPIPMDVMLDAAKSAGVIE